MFSPALSRLPATDRKINVIRQVMDGSQSNSNNTIDHDSMIIRGAVFGRFIVGSASSILSIKRRKKHWQISQGHNRYPENAYAQSEGKTKQKVSTMILG